MGYYKVNIQRTSFFLIELTVGLIISFLILEPLPVSTEKYKDLRELAKFCSNIAADRFFTNLKHCERPKTKKK